MNESKKISTMVEKKLYFIEVCMSLQDPNTMFIQRTLRGSDTGYLYAGKEVTCFSS
jgi:hypothetical protein